MHKAIELWHNNKLSWFSEVNLNFSIEKHILIKSIYSLISIGTERLVISEHLPKELSNKMSNMLFGCDICQDVCPWNKFQQTTKEVKYHPKSENIKPELKKIVKISQDEFKKRFKKSPVYRTGWKNFIRNISTVLKNITT